MAFRAGRLTVTDVRSKIADGSDAGSALIRNRHATQSVFLGASTVEASGVNVGWELAAGESLEVRLAGRGDEVHAICAATQSVDVERIYS